MTEQPQPIAKGRRMKDLWVILIFVGVYLALQLWILPKLGVST